MMIFGVCPIAYEGENSTEVLKSWKQFNFDSETDSGEDFCLRPYIKQCLSFDPKERPSPRALLQSPFYAALSGTLFIRVL